LIHSIAHSCQHFGIDSGSLGLEYTFLTRSMQESQVAAEAEYALRQAGAEGFWRTYVSSGPRTSIVHGLPGARRLQNEDLVMIDVHPILEGYSADMGVGAEGAEVLTRTLRRLA
jgi:Xaa-Pro aminopeptidase